MTEDVRGRSRSFIGEDNTPVGWALVKSAPTSRSSREDPTVEPCRDRPKLVPRRQVRGQPGSDCRKMVRRHAGRTLVGIRGFGFEPPATGRACGVGMTQVVRSVIERFTGARIVSRLQRSVRSIFPALPRRAERQTEAERDSANRRRVPGRGRVERVGQQGCEELRENVIGTARLFARL